MSWTYGLAPREMKKLEGLLPASPDLDSPACDCALHAGVRASHPRLGWRGQVIPVVVLFEGALPVLDDAPPPAPG
jgi:hypothetical protein